MSEDMGLHDSREIMNSGIKQEIPSVQDQNGSAQSYKGARKRKGKPVKIYQKEHQSDSDKVHQEDCLNGHDSSDKDLYIGRACKRKLLIRFPTRPKAHDKLATENIVGTGEDSLGSEFRDCSLTLKAEDKSKPKGRTLCRKTKPSPSQKFSAATGQSRTEYRKTWCKNRPYHHCPTCEYKTRDKDTFKSHLAKHDPNAERFTCETCSKTFRNKRSFQWHLRVHRTPEQLHHCSRCSYRTPQRSIWLRHMNEVHKVDSEGKHLNDDIKCGECNFACVTQYRLKLHVKAKHCEKQHKCPECPYSAISKSDVEKHVIIRHRNERRHLCSQCGYMAKTTSALNDHARGHLGLKTFVCDICGKAYARGDKLKIHLRTHSDDQKPYICPHCMHACSRKDHLQVHLKRVHKDLLENESTGLTNDIDQRLASTNDQIKQATETCC